MAGVAAVVGAVAAVGSVAVSAQNGRRAATATQEGAQAADPAASQRPFYQAQLQNQWPTLSSVNYNDILKDPSFQFLHDTGMRDLNNKASADGTLRSGTLMEDMSTFNQNLASTYIDKQFQRNMALMGQLGNFSGLNTGQPGVAGQLIAQGGMNQYGIGNNIWSQIGSGVSMASRIGGGPSGSPWANGASMPYYTGYGAGGDPSYG